MATNTLTNIAAVNAAQALAAAAAQQEYLRMRLYLLEIPEMQSKSLIEQDQLAFQWSQFAWQTAFQTATLTGKLPAGGLQLQLPSLQTLRSATGVTPATGTFAGGSGIAGVGGTTGITGTGGAAGGQVNSDAFKQALISQGIQNWGSLPLEGTIGQGDFDNWIGFFKNFATDIAPTDPRIAAAISAAKSAGYNTTSYDQWYQGVTGQPAPGSAAATAAAGTAAAAGTNPFAPIGAGTAVAGAPSSVNDLGLPGLAPGETPSLEYIQALSHITGMLAGQPTLEAGQLLGTFNGQPTLAGQELAGVMANGDRTLTAQQLAGYMLNGDPTLQREQIGGELSGYYGGAPTLARETEYNTRAMQLLQLASTLRADPIRAMMTLGQTPGGLRDVFNAAAGQMQLPGYSAGQPGTPVNDMGQFVGDTASLMGLQPTQVAPEGTQADPMSYNYQVNRNGSLDQYPPGTTAPAGGAQVSSTAPMSYQQAIQQALQATPYVAPSQVSSQQYNQMQPTMQDQLWKSYELYGLDPEMAKSAYQASLPQYASPTVPRGTVLLENR